MTECIIAMRKVTLVAEEEGDTVGTLRQVKVKNRASIAAPWKVTSRLKRWIGVEL